MSDWARQIEDSAAPLDAALADSVAILNRITDDVILPALARNYANSGLMIHSGMLFEGITRRDGKGNYIRIDGDAVTVGVDPTIVPYALPILEGSRPHDIPNAFGRGPHFGIGGRFGGKFHPGNEAYPIYYLLPEDYEEASLDAARFVVGKVS